jgi:endonuclease YncB( thermonuclease family)
MLRMPAGQVTATTACAIGVLVGATIAPVMAGRWVGGEGDAPARAAGSAALRGAYAADVMRVIDGDTFEARVHVWPGLDVTTKVRLRGIDAPELQARCGAERAKGEAARTMLAGLLAEGGITVLQVALDKYGGRVIAAAATARTADVADAMLAHGAVRHYAGGRREGWCG